MKRVVFEFVGGYWDGMVLESGSSRLLANEGMTEADYVKGILAMTDNGTVGKGFVSLLSSSLIGELRAGRIKMDDLKPSRKHHRYTVVDKSEHDEEMRLRMEYSLYPPAATQND